MSIKPIVIMGVPSLLEKSKPIENFNSVLLKELINDMKDTQNHLHGVGIAAPQIAVNLRVILFGFDTCARYPNQPLIKQTVLINPEFQALTDEKELDWEGCLSLPGLRGAVPRYTHIRYWGYDLNGKRLQQEVKGFHARVIQHEIDHLDGVLYIHRIEDKRLFGYEGALNLLQQEES